MGNLGSLLGSSSVVTLPEKEPNPENVPVVTKERKSYKQEIKKKKPSKPPTMDASEKNWWEELKKDFSDVVKNIPASESGGMSGPKLYLGEYLDLNKKGLYYLAKAYAVAHQIFGVTLTTRMGNQFEEDRNTANGGNGPLKIVLQYRAELPNDPFGLDQVFVLGKANLEGILRNIIAKEQREFCTPCLFALFSKQFAFPEKMKEIMIQLSQEPESDLLTFARFMQKIGTGKFQDVENSTIQISKFEKLVNDSELNSPTREQLSGIFNFMQLSDSIEMSPEEVGRKLPEISLSAQSRRTALVDIVHADDSAGQLGATEEKHEGKHFRFARSFWHTKLST